MMRGERTHVCYLDSVSARAFVSHYAAKSEDDLEKDDLLPQIRGKTLLISDMAPLLNSSERELQEILGILTRVLDGEGYYSAKGVHGLRGYGGPGQDYRFAMVAASTPLRGLTIPAVCSSVFPA